MAKNRQMVYMFDEGNGDNENPSVRGGKGAGLNWLLKNGYPVPYGFTISPTLARAYQETGTFPVRFAWQFDRCLGLLEKRTGKKLGDPNDPLILSVRSGSEFSMPGMMDSVLNVGLSFDIINSQEDEEKKNFYLRCYYRFICSYLLMVSGVNPDELDYCRISIMRNFQKSVLEFDNEELDVLCRCLMGSFKDSDGLFLITNDIKKQIDNIILAIIKSWQSDRARAYRVAKQIPEWKQTAVNVQEMVFGDLDERSATGVAFSHDLVSGEEGVNGECSFMKQGEEHVSGNNNPETLDCLDAIDPQLHSYLTRTLEHLARVHSKPMEVEWTVESGKMHILQMRAAQLTATAKAALLVRKVWSKAMGKEEAAEMLGEDELRQLRQKKFDPQAINRATLLASGIGASQGSLSGVAVFNKEELLEEKAAGNKTILVRAATTPNDFSLMLQADAIITSRGGNTCHAAVVAKGLNKPAIVGIQSMELRSEYAVFGRGGGIYTGITSGTNLSIDAYDGRVYLGELPLVVEANRKEVNLYLKWVGNYRKLVFEPKADFTLYGSKGLDINVAIMDFYLLNAMKDKADGMLKQEIFGYYRTYVADLAKRILTYLVLASAGEARHTEEFHSGRFPAEIKILREKYGVSYGQSRNECCVRVCEKLEGKSKNELIAFCEFIHSIMASPNWTKGSYGGRKWADIIRTASMYLKSEIGPELFIDRAFDLEHNGGSVFGKNQMLDGRRDDIKEQLDAKHRAESVPDLYKGVVIDFKKPSLEVERFFTEGKKNNYW